MIEISIIVPVYNGSKYIDGFIDSIEKNTMDPSRFEVIFVDNGSTDNSVVKIVEVIKRLDGYNVRILECEKQGSSYAARNRGVREARGRILSFIDVDCILYRDYLSSVIKIVGEGISYAGHVEIVSEDTNVWEIFDAVIHMNNEDNAKKKRLVTANMCMGKKTFEEVGDFEEICSGGDYLYGEKLQKKGVKIIYTPEIGVHHPSRKTYAEVKNKLLRVAYGEGQIYFLKKRKRIRGIGIQILRILNLPKHIYITKKIVKRSGFRCIGEFNILYLYIKVKQIVAFMEGYNSINN